VAPRRDDKGDDFERRTARLLTAEGAFVRRRVTLEPRFGERFLVTDCDLLTFEIGRTLAWTMAVGECKTTEAKGSPSAADRLLWLTGVRALVGAKASFLATTRSASDVVRRLGAALGSEVMDERDILRREGIHGLQPEAEGGPHGRAQSDREHRVFEASRGDDELRRLYWFARSEVWLLEPVPGIKRALGALRVLTGRWAPGLPAPQDEALRFLAGEIVTATALDTVRIARDAYSHPEEIFANRLAEQLAEGLADYRTLVELSKTLDRYILGFLRQAGVDPGKAVGAIGAFSPKPPSYAEPLTELIARFAEAPTAASRLPVYVAARFAGEHGATVEDQNETARLARLLAVFLDRQARLPADLLEPIGRNGEAHGSEESATIPAESDPGVDRASPDPESVGTLFGEG
jgi:hypothetical protein